MGEGGEDRGGDDRGRRIRARQKSVGWSLLTGILGLTAFVLTWMGSVRCDFVQIVGAGGSSEPIVREFGIWYYQTISYVAATDGRIIIKACRSYPDGTDLDPAWKAARAFSSLTFGLSVIILCVRAATACASDPDRHRNRGGGVVAGPLHLLAGVCQGLTLLLLRSNVCEDNPLVEAMDVDFENECGISRGGELTIGATAFWAAAAAASFGEQKAWAEEREGRRRVSPASMTEPLNP